jgi:fucose 4-O-acetylase-like acetyltransferase
MVLLVVNMHACVTYSHVGGWYLKDPPEPGLGVKIPFLYWQGHLQAFFMGLLFFLAGVFAHGACLRRGPAGFVRERLLRLGAPAAFYMLVIQPFIGLVLLRRPGDRAIGELYLRYLSSGRVLSGSGPLWFAVALLIFCLALALKRAVLPGAAQAERRSPPSWGALTALGCLLVVATFAFRLVQPLDTDFFNLQLGFFAQYIAAFSVGVLAGQHGWLEALASSRVAAGAGWAVLVAGPLGMTATLLLGGLTQTGDFQPFKGGWHWQAFGLAAWEQLSGVALGLGAMALFRRRFNTEGPLATWMARHSFGVYVLHAPILVALALAMHPLPGGPVFKMLLLTVLGLVLSHAAAALAKRVPGLRQIL